MTAAPPRVVYLHGFNSSPASGKARQTEAYCAARGWRCDVPALSHDPRVAIERIEALVTEGEAPALLIGSSLGGYYAAWLAERHDLKAALVNPAVSPAKLHREAFVGEHENYYSGERFRIDHAMVDALDAIDPPAFHRPQNLLVLLQTGDELLDYRRALDKYRGARHIVQEGGSHRFEHFEAMLPEIFAFAGLVQAHSD